MRDDLYMVSAKGHLRCAKPSHLAIPSCWAAWEHAVGAFVTHPTTGWETADIQENSEDFQRRRRAFAHCSQVVKTKLTRSTIGTSSNPASNLRPDGRQNMIPTGYERMDGHYGLRQAPVAPPRKTCGKVASSPNCRPADVAHPADGMHMLLGGLSVDWRSVVPPPNGSCVYLVDGGATFQKRRRGE